MRLASPTTKAYNRLSENPRAIARGFFPDEPAFYIDNEYFQMYNCINSQKGDMTMFVVYINAVDNKSGNPMRWYGVGLALSYSF